VSIVDWTLEVVVLPVADIDGAEKIMADSADGTPAPARAATPRPDSQELLA
jgi:hypothetical protein